MGEAFLKNVELGVLRFLIPNIYIRVRQDKDDTIPELYIINLHKTGKQSQRCKKIKSG